LEYLEFEDLTVDNFDSAQHFVYEYLSFFMNKRILVKNGLIVSEKDTIKADILIEDGIITEIKEHIKVKDAVIVDAKGQYVLPGGIDAHVHLCLSTANGTIADDFREGSIAALAGGTTTFIDFITPERHESITDATHKRKKEATNSLIDYALHGSITSWNENTFDEMKACVEKEGITSYKIYMAYKKGIGINDDIFFKTMRSAKALGIIVLSHCENGDVIDLMQEEALSNKHYEAKYHALTRPSATETEAINRALMMAQITEAPLYIVHVSTAEGARLIKEAKKDGLKVFAETCPHYLLLNDKAYKSPDHPEKYIMSPPLRKQKDQNYLWKALTNESIDVVSTDHCSYLLKDKINKRDFTKVPNGIAGLETRLSLLFTYGVLESKFSVNRFVALTASNPAKMFGLYPRKGTISVGSDADIVIWQKKKSTLTNKQLHHKSDHTVFERMTTLASPQTVICGGHLAYDNGKLNTEGMKGRYLKRSGF